MKQAIAVLFVLSVAVPAHAQEERTRSRSRTLAGMLLILGGAGVTAAAFNFRSGCDRWYRATAGYGLDNVDYCRSVPTGQTFPSGGHASTRELSTSFNLELARRPLLYTGMGMIVLGGMLITVWSDVPVARDLDIRAGPGQLRVGRTIGF